MIRSKYTKCNWPHLKSFLACKADVYIWIFLYLNLSLSGEDVPVTHCEGEPPPTEVACEVACSADCVVGSWSSWSACSHSCATKNTEGRQSRTRTVLALPGKGEATLPLAYLDFRHMFMIFLFAVFVAVVFLCQTSKITDFNQSVTNWVKVLFLPKPNHQPESGLQLQFLVSDSCTLYTHHPPQPLPCNSSAPHKCYVSFSQINNKINNKETLCFPYKHISWCKFVVYKSNFLENSNTVGYFLYIRYFTGNQN